MTEDMEEIKNRRDGEDEEEREAEEGEYKKD